MLFEIAGKVYEINDTFLFIVGGIIGVFTLLFVIWGLGSFFASMPILAEPASIDAPSVEQQPIPKEAQVVLNSNPKATAEDLCSFDGRGRLAGKIANKFDCRSTENLKIITLKASTVYCCVVP